MGMAGTKLVFGAALAALLMGSACGPIEYVNEVTRKASNSVAAAKSVSNEEDAHYVYWYTLAVEYLHKAREEASYADYQAANRFGRRAAFAAKKARETAMKSAADPSSMVRTPDLEGQEGSVPADDGFSDIDIDGEEP
jgi:hypothetical protein